MNARAAAPINVNSTTDSSTCTPTACSLRGAIELANTTPGADTIQVPSGTYLSLAIGSIGLSLALQLTGRKHAATFVGQWVPTILLLGLYNKLVKVAGSDPVQIGR